MPKDGLPESIARIDVLLAKIEKLSDPVVRGDVQEIVQCLLDYHGAALAELLTTAQAASGGSRALVDEFARNELVSSLLLLHGLHPADLESRVLGALERVRPFLESHGGDVELVRLVDGVVQLRLHGSCHGCPSSAATLKTRIEQAIYEAAPDVSAIEVVAEDARPAMPSGFVGLERLSAGQLDAKG